MHQLFAMMFKGECGVVDAYVAPGVFPYPPYIALYDGVLSFGRLPSSTSSFRALKKVPQFVDGHPVHCHSLPESILLEF